MSKGLGVVGLIMGIALLAQDNVNAEDEIPLLFMSDATNTAQMHLLWQTEPGVRYNLHSTSNLLDDWTQVPGYPAVADGLSRKYQFAKTNREFFRIGALDEQPPVVVSQYPAVDGFAVGRFADLFVQLEDMSGIDFASIQLAVGSIGPLGPVEEGLVIASNTITYDSGVVPLGDWGETVTATLVIADMQGHVLTNIWNFRLETEPATATNVFVFGSPPAQAMGQKVRGPATILTARYPASPIPKNTRTESDWIIEMVNSNSVVIAYSAGMAPEFATNQLICNLVPAAENEIFYRRILSTSNDTVNSKLTIATEDAVLTDFVSQGGLSLSESSVILELNTNGAMVKAISIGGTLTFPRIGMDLSGTEFKLREDGYEVTVKGEAYSLGNDPDWLEVSLSEWAWWLTPRIRAGLEIDSSGLKSFEAIAQGDVAIDNVFNGKVLLIGVSAENTLFDLKGPTTVIYLGQLGPIPVFATLGLKMGLTAEAEAKAQVEFDGTYRQDHSVAFGLTYERATGLEPVHSFQSTAPDLQGEAALVGELSFHLTLDPRVEFLVYALAGMKAAVEPSAGVVTTVPLIGGTWDGYLEADVDFVLGTAGPAFELLDNNEELKFNIWHGEWPLIPQALSFTTHPQGKTVALGDAVAFSCTVDATSTPNYQWFHKGLPIPGQVSRSLFIHYVNPGHAGNYVVRATAGNLTADSNPATLVVQNPTPATLDSDGDGISNIYETNTGIWVSPTDRGTSPSRSDSDGDGLGDGVENNTGIFVSRLQTGTNPNRADTDGDGVNDKREIDFGTNPNSAFDGDYMVIDLSAGPSASSYPVSYLTVVPPGGWSDIYKTTKVVLRRIFAGTFTMGSPVGELLREGDETQHAVTLTKDFYVGVFEVTQKQWGLVMGKWPSYFNNPSCWESRPVERVSYTDIRGAAVGTNWPVSGNVDATSFMGRLRARTGHAFDLPTESQWEFACRARAITALNSGYNLTNSGSDVHMAEVGRYRYNGGAGSSQGSDTSKGTAKAGSYLPNAWGLYDMHGNVYEWCLDRYGTYPGTVIDPKGAVSGKYYVLRGGCWSLDAFTCRSAFRYHYANSTDRDNYLGFRLARPLP